jgi:hypothetical protein
MKPGIIIDYLDWTKTKSYSNIIAKKYYAWNKQKISYYKSNLKWTNFFKVIKQTFDEQKLNEQSS